MDMGFGGRQRGGGIIRHWLRNHARYPLPNPPPGPTQNANVFCVGTRPLRTLARPAREGAERWQLMSMDDGRFCICRFAGCWLPPPRPSPTGGGVERWGFG